MPSASYYREQAKVLHSLAMVTSDQEFAAQLEARRRLYLTKAGEPQVTGADFTGTLDSSDDPQRGKA
jgi:hypothetical protein